MGPSRLVMEMFFCEGDNSSGGFHDLFPRGWTGAAVRWLQSLAYGVCQPVRNYRKSLGRQDLILYFCRLCKLSGAHNSGVFRDRWSHQCCSAWILFLNFLSFLSSLPLLQSQHFALSQPSSSPEKDDWGKSGLSNARKELAGSNFLSCSSMCAVAFLL